MQMNFADKMELVSRLIIKGKKYSLLQKLVTLENEEELRKFYKKHELHKIYKGEENENM